VFYKSGNFIRHHFLKITSVKCFPFRCTHSGSRFWRFCIARRSVFSGMLAMFSSIWILSWARFVGLVWYTTLFRCQSQTGLFKFTNTCVLHVQKELNHGAESYSGVKHFVQLSHCHHFSNTHSWQPHAPDRSTAPLQLNVRYYSTVWRFPPTYCTSTGLPTSASNFPVSLRHPVLCISESILKCCLLLITNNRSKYIYWDCSGSIFNFLKYSLHDYL
jgi:hypothetical protein